jgi:hypothetical protein
MTESSSGVTPSSFLQFMSTPASAEKVVSGETRLPHKRFAIGQERTDQNDGRV